MGGERMSHMQTPRNGARAAPVLDDRSPVLGLPAVAALQVEMGAFALRRMSAAVHAGDRMMRCTDLTELSGVQAAYMTDMARDYAGLWLLMTGGVVDKAMPPGGMFSFRHSGTPV
jgi:hypothetical protein